MKNNMFSAIIFCAAVAMSPLYGCGGSKDESKEAAPAHAETQKAAGPGAGQSAGGAGTPSRNTEPAEIPEMLPAVQEAGTGQPAETVTQKAEPAKTAGSPADARDTKTGQHAESEAPAPRKADVSQAETQPAKQEAPDVITIENKGYAADKKGPVKLSHLKHDTDYKVSCDQCHHLYKDGANQWKEGDHVDKCIVCHSPLEDKDKAVKLQSAFHKNCRDCHSDVNKEGKEAPSTKCSDCHG